MISRIIHGATHCMKPPIGWDPEKNGGCADLYVKIDGNVYMSAWEPTPEELGILNRGGSVVLSIVGGQPPVALWVSEP